VNTNKYEYQKKYYIKNRERIIKKNKEYAAKHKALYKSYYTNNIEDQRLYKKIYARAYREKNKERMTEYNKVYYKQYYIDNKDYIDAKQKQYFINKTINYL
jgi:hypothetical protein